MEIMKFDFVEEYILNELQKQYGGSFTKKEIKSDHDWNNIKYIIDDFLATDDDILKLDNDFDFENLITDEIKNNNEKKAILASIAAKTALECNDDDCTFYDYDKYAYDEEAEVELRFSKKGSEYRFMALYENIPTINIIINTKTTELSKIYVGNEYRNNENFFYITDDQIDNLLRLPPETIYNFSNTTRIVSELESENKTMHKLASEYLNDYLEKQRKHNPFVRNICSEIKPTFYGIYLKLSTKNKEKKSTCFRINKSELMKEDYYFDDELHAYIQKCANKFLRKIKQSSKEIQ